MKRLNRKNRVLANRSFSGRRRITAATESGMQIIVKTRGYVDIYEDDYERGEGAHVNSWDVDVRGAYRTFNDLIKAIVNECYALSSDPQNYVFVDGTIQTDATVDGDNDEPSSRQLEAWKRGEQMLYTARLVLPVEVGMVSHEMTEDEAEMFGISIY